MKKRKYEEFDDYYEDDEDEIDLVDLVFVLLRRWKLITMVALPVFIAGFFFAATRPSVYKAETTLMISAPSTSVGLDSSDLSVSQRLVITYSEIAKSRSILNGVIGRYDLVETPEDLGKLIKISTVDNSELIRLSYTNKDARLSAAVINQVAKEFTNKIVEVMNVRNVKIVEEAEIPRKPLPKKRMLILAASLVFGLMLGGAAAFVVEFLHKKLRKPSDIEKILGVQMIGMVPDFTDKKIMEDNSNE